MNIFEEVKHQLNISQVIEHYGFKIDRAHRFVCPFHNDHKPSASVKNDYFNCFVCGTGGDLITFTAKYLGLSNLDAAKELVREFNLDIDISTTEERRAEKAAERKKREEIRSCNGIRDKFEKDKEIRAGARKTTFYKLRNEIRMQNKKIDKEKSDYINHVGFLLADFHRFLWQGLQMYDYGHERHTKALQELSSCEYYLEWFEQDPDDFINKNMGVIQRYERELDCRDKQK